MRRAGFTLIEMTVALGIFVVILLIAIPTYNAFIISADLDVAVEQTTQGLNRARLLSQAGYRDSPWGFYIPNGTLYKGASYATRDPAFDEIYTMSSSVEVSGVQDISYGMIFGMPSQLGLVYFTATDRQRRMMVVQQERKNVSILEGGRLTVCHNGSINLSLPDSAWPAHSRHGDYLGPCTSSASSSGLFTSSASASTTASTTSFSTTTSMSSSAQTTTSSSVSSVSSCHYTMDSDGLLHVVGNQDVTFTVLGAYLTYVGGSPTIEITAQYSTHSNGNGNFSDLFSGQTLNGNGGQTQTVTLSNGSYLRVSVKGCHKQRGYLTYNVERITNEDSPLKLRILRNGDPVPTLAANNGVNYLATVSSNGIMTLSPNEVVLAVDLEELADEHFQDALIKVSFGSPSC